MGREIRSLMIIAGEGGRPCGVRDYAESLARKMPASSAATVHLALPYSLVNRTRLLKIREIRRNVARAARSMPKVDLVHVQYADCSWNGTRVFEDAYEVFSRRCSVPLVMTIHEHPWFRNEHQFDQPRTQADHVFARIAGYWRIPASFPLELLERHRGIHVHQQWQKDVLMANGMGGGKIRVIPLAIPKCLALPVKGEGFTRRFGLLGRRILAVTGFVFERKRYERVLDLLPDLPSDVVLCALGGANGAASERYLAWLKSRADKLGVASRFVVTGYLSELEMNEGLSSADLFVAPYGEVTSSASVARGIGTGLPVVTEKCATFNELQAGGAGLVVVDLGDKGALLRVLLGLLEKKESYEDLCQKNRDYAVRWSFPNVANHLYEWYSECLDNDFG